MGNEKAIGSPKNERGTCSRSVRRRSCCTGAPSWVSLSIVLMWLVVLQLGIGACATNRELAFRQTCGDGVDIFAKEPDGKVLWAGKCIPLSQVLTLVRCPTGSVPIATTSSAACVNPPDAAPWDTATIYCRVAEPDGLSMSANNPFARGPLYTWDARSGRLYHQGVAIFGTMRGKHIWWSHISGRMKYAACFVPKNQSGPDWAMESTAWTTEDPHIAATQDCPTPVYD